MISIRPTSLCDQHAVLHRPVTKINGVNIGSSKPGLMVKRLLDHWSQGRVDTSGRSNIIETGTRVSSNPFVELKR